MLKAQRAHDDIQVGAAAGVNHPGDIMWRSIAWSAGEKDVASVKVAKRAGESREQPSSALSGKTVTSDLQRVALVENDDGEGGIEGRVQLGRGSEVDKAAADKRGKAIVGYATTEWVVLSDAERMEMKELKRLKKKQRKSPASKNRSPTMGGHNETARHARHLKHLSNL